nr:1,4-dihydroxy-6-naphthoate synthase [Desulfobulbaceae bacterium]
MYPSLSLAFSPCPNDTFIFNALVNGMTRPDGFSLSEVHYEDVETLNLWAMSAEMDITKLSFHALGHVLDSYELLCSGSALGRGCGPLLVCKKGARFSSPKAVAIPGRFTTASLLLKMCFPEFTQLKEMRFDQIMPAIVSGSVEAGVIIHESRFTYRQHGLELVQDLGLWWEETTGFPIPLGGIAVRKDLGPELIAKIDGSVRQSLQWARQNPEKCHDYIKRYAQELDDTVIANHINLYVNDFSVNLGHEGLAAIHEFLDRGYGCGAFPGRASQVCLKC